VSGRTKAEKKKARVQDHRMDGRPHKKGKMAHKDMNRRVNNSKNKRSGERGKKGRNRGTKTNGRTKRILPLNQRKTRKKIPGSKGMCKHKKSNEAMKSSQGEIAECEFRRGNMQNKKKKKQKKSKGENLGRANNPDQDWKS